MDFHNKKVLDYGTGTGVLAILAAKMKATSVWAIDNDISAYENTLENSSINNCPGLKVFHSTIEMIEENAVFDIILANINRNTLLNSVLEITKKADLGAQLVMSGFYENDLRDIQKAFEKDWSYESHSVREGWCCVILNKKYS